MVPLIQSGQKLLRLLQIHTRYLDMVLGLKLHHSHFCAIEKRRFCQQKDRRSEPYLGLVMHSYIFWKLLHIPHQLSRTENLENTAYCRVTTMPTQHLGRTIFLLAAEGVTLWAVAVFLCAQASKWQGLQGSLFPFGCWFYWSIYVWVISYCGYVAQVRTWPSAHHAQTTLALLDTESYLHRCFW